MNVIRAHFGAERDYAAMREQLAVEAMARGGFDRDAAETLATHMVDLVKQFQAASRATLTVKPSESGEDAVQQVEAWLRAYSQGLQEICLAALASAFHSVLSLAGDRGKA